MRSVEVVIVVMSSILLVIIVVGVFIAALYGVDLRTFDRYKTTAPKQYRRLRSVCRINCPMVALLCVGGLIATPFIACEPNGGIWLAIGNFVVSAMFLWLSVRWFLWSLRA